MGVIESEAFITFLDLACHSSEYFWGWLIRPSGVLDKSK